MICKILLLPHALYHLVRDEQKPLTHLLAEAFLGLFDRSEGFFKRENDGELDSKNRPQNRPHPNLGLQRAHAQCSDLVQI